MFKNLLTLLLVSIVYVPIRAQGTPLQPGDIAIIAFQSDNNDQFAFVCLVDIQAGTKIQFSEKGWDGSLAIPAFSVTTEGVHTWTAPVTGVSKGTTITVEFNSLGQSPMASLGSINSSAAAKFSTSGDQLLAFQGNASAPNFIYGFASRSWINAGTPTSTQSWLPSNLVNGVSARDFATESDDQYFKMITNTGSKEMLLAAIGNVANWARSNTRYASLPVWGFTVSTDYYSKPAGPITDLNNWGTAMDGSGMAPASFTESNMNYHVANRSGTLLLESNWTVGKLNLEKDLHLGLNNYQLTLDEFHAASGALLEGSTGSQLVITGNAGTISFAADKAVLKGLTLMPHATAGLGQPLEICAGPHPGFVLLGDNANLNSNGFLILDSDESGSACINTMGNQAAIVGTVEVRGYIPGGRRNFRFLSHPFSHAIGLNSLTNDIDITGSGGSLNGFTNTATNNPSAFLYDPLSGDGSANDPGWIAFNNTNGLNGNAWFRWQGIRINIRGKKGEGLNGAAYSPSPTLLHIRGVVNTGDQILTLQKSGTGPGFNLIGNPFPSAIDMSKLIIGANVAPSYYVWDPHQGTKGGYSCYLFSSPTILPVLSAFFVQTNNGNAGNTILFPESAKSLGTSPIKLTGSGAVNIDQLELSISSDSIFWDKQLFILQDSTADKMKKQDAKKLINPDLNFYSIGADQEKLSIDNRLLQKDMSIPVLVDTKLEMTVLMTAPKIPILHGFQLFLHDKFAQKSMLIDSGFHYSFKTGAAYPADRFEIRTGPLVQPMIRQVPSNFSVQVFPNPVKEKLMLKIFSSSGNEIRFSLFNANGQLIRTDNLGLPENLQYEVDCSYLSSGIYFMSVSDGIDKQVQKIIKP